MITMTIPGIPTPKLRARISRRKGYITMYDPQEPQKKLTKFFISNFVKINHLCTLMGGIEAHFTFYFPPSYISMKDEKEKLWNETYHVQKPDVDNLIKFYLDCANEILFGDDTQIVKCYGEKKYSSNPRVEIKLEEIKMTEIKDNDKNIIYIFTPKELGQLKDDCNGISKFFEDVVAKSEEGIDEIWASTASVLLKCFSERWSKKLTKIGKL